MNRSLKGYRVTLPRAHFQLLGLSVTLKDLTVRQQAHPDPPVAVIPRLHASVQWRELLRLRLVGDFLFDHPKIYANLPQLQQEAAERIPVTDRGWQQALEKVYPLKINLLRIDDGEITYIDEDPEHPLRITRLVARANNIRNIHSREHVYPSPIWAEAAVFETGRLRMDGHADFLAEPFPGFHFLLKLKNVPVERIRPLTARSNMEIRGGVLETAGEIEYSAKTKTAHLTDLTISGMRLDYVHTLSTASAEAERVQTVARAAKKVTNEPGVLLKLDRLELARCEIGWVNKARTPAYRLFLSGVHLTVANFSNHFEQGPAEGRLKARFMGSGATSATARFRPETDGPDFDVKVAIEGTQLAAMNDLLRAYGKFDVTSGDFSFYSELHFKNGQVTGYVKPLFRDMKVYDKRQDAEKGLFRKLYEKLVGGVAGLLQNRSTERVATQASIEGPVGNAKASTWEIIARLIENAFFRAILPGLDEAISPKNGKIGRSS